MNATLWCLEADELQSVYEKLDLSGDIYLYGITIWEMETVGLNPQNGVEESE